MASKNQIRSLFTSSALEAGRAPVLHHASWDISYFHDLESAIAESLRPRVLPVHVQNPKNKSSLSRAPLVRDEALMKKLLEYRGSNFMASSGRIIRKQKP